MNNAEKILAFLLKLNPKLDDKEPKDKPIGSPGLLPSVKSPTDFVSDDCVTVDN
jgi:hypothetical protein